MWLILFEFQKGSVHFQTLLRSIVWLWNPILVSWEIDWVSHFSEMGAKLCVVHVCYLLQNSMPWHVVTPATTIIVTNCINL
jgi:hypothetical protein